MSEPYFDEVRAHRRDASGQTAQLQGEVLRLVAACGPRGLTIAELREAYPDRHHGSLSGALSSLHKENRISRLTEARSRCKVYVHPAYVGERTVEMHGGRVHPADRAVRAVRAELERDSTDFIEKDVVRRLLNRAD